MHGSLLSTVATGALLLKNRAIRIHGANQVSTAFDLFQTMFLHLKMDNIRKQILIFRNGNSALLDKSAL